MKSFLSILSAASLGIATLVQADPASFDTPQAAFEALTDAVEQRDSAAFERLFGAEDVDLLLSEDKAENAVNRLAFLSLVREGYRFSPVGDGVTLIVGADDWPFPVPIVKRDGAWQFDPVAGREEIRAREIGLNELDVMDLLRAYVDLQAQFRRVDHDGDGVMEFARTIISDAEARDGLFWPGGPGLVGQALARAAFEGWSDGEADYDPEPFMGYYFKILHEQGPAAPGGAFSYVLGGNLVGGHALLAVPAVYGETGVHSFIVGENGILYEADLGEETLAKAAEIGRYDPDPTWGAVE